MELSGVISQKIRTAIKTKLVELGAYAGDEFPDYIMVMVANKKKEQEMSDQLQLFLGSNTEKFTKWLTNLLNKVLSITPDNPDGLANLDDSLNDDKTGGDAPLTLQEDHDEFLAQEKAADGRKISKVAPQPKRTTDSDKHSSKETKHRKRQNAHDDHAPKKRQLSSAVVRPGGGDDFNDEEDDDGLVGKSTVSSVVKINRHGGVDPRLAPGKNLLVRAVNEARVSTKRSKSERQPETASVAPIVQDGIVSRSRRLASEQRKRPAKRPPPPASDEDDEDHASASAAAPSTTTARRRRSLRVKAGADGARSIKESRRSDSQRRQVERSAVESKTSALLRASSSEDEPAMTVLGDDDAETIVGTLHDAYRRANDLGQLSDDDDEERVDAQIDSDNDEGLRQMMLKSKRKHKSGGGGGAGKPASIQAIISTVLHRRKYDVDSADSLKPQPKFIVTLEGISDSYFRGFSNSNLDDPSPSVESLQSKAPRSAHLTGDPGLLWTAVPPPPHASKGRASGPGSQTSEGAATAGGGAGKRPTERCRFWPACKNGESCPFHHPTVPCKSFPNCPYGNRCLYIHPNCRFDSQCTKPHCPFTHSTSQRRTSGGGGGGGGSGSMPFFSNTVVPSGGGGASQRCRFGVRCQNPSCVYTHPKPCRFGAACLNKGACPFMHPATGAPTTPGTAQAAASQMQPPAPSIPSRFTWKPPTLPGSRTSNATISPSA